MPEVDMLLDGSITEDEIKRAINNFKNGKASGDDGVLNEYLKSTLNELMPIYMKLFSIIFDSGKIPENWNSGILIAKFKNKGSRSDPEFYRDVTLNSYFSKTFSSILNNRLNIFSDTINLISGLQAGFRKGFSTTDNVFVLYALITIYFSFGKKIFFTFVDFESAFDTVWRTGLWQKLQKSKIKGKLFTVIYNMYQKIKSCVKLGKDCSDFLSCDIGVWHW
jgi:hypothetical protein